MTPLATRPRLLVPALLAGVLSATVLLSACGGTSSSPSASGGSSRPSTVASAATSGTPAPDATGSGGPAGNGSGGGSGSGGSGVGNRNACKVLTRQDASSILGQAVDAGKDGSSLGIPYPSCTYTATGGSQSVDLTIFDATATANLINQYKGQFSDLTPLPGVGDAALSEGDGRLVVATKGTVGCVVLRAGDVSGSAATSTQLMANICKKVFAG